MSEVETNKTVKSIVLFLLLFLFASHPVLSSNIEKDDVQNEEITPQNHSVIENGSQNNEINDPKIFKRKQRYGQYRGLLSSNFMTIGSYARQEGVRATGEEIALKKRAFNTLFPGELVTDYELEMEICTKKYGDFLCPGNNTSSEIQRFYNDLSNEYERNNIPDFETIKPLLETIALWNVCTLLRDKWKELQTQIENEMNERFKKQNTNWTCNDLSVDADSSACIAKHVDSNCILSVGEYNKYIRYYCSSQTWTNAKAREIAVNNMLRDKYVRNEAKKKGFTATDSAKIEQKQWIESVRTTLKLGTIGLPVSEYGELVMVYDKYYKLLFEKKTNPYCSILGSCDSAYIDSIYKFTKEPKSHTDGTNVSVSGRRKSGNPESTIPWAHSRGTILVPEIMTVLDTLKLNSISEMIRLPYGFFIIRLDSVKAIPGLSFEDALPKVNLIATKMKWQDYDSLLMEQAFSIYKKDPRISRVMDTLMLEVFLKPGIVSDTGKNMQAQNSSGRIKKSADSMECFLTTNSEMLPHDVRNQLLDSYMQSKSGNKEIKLFSSAYGSWFFKITGSRKGQGKIPFSIVRRRIIDSLVTVFADSSLYITDTTMKMDSIGYNVSLANVYMPRFYGLKKNAEKTPEEMVKVAKRDDELEKNIFSKVTVDTSLLFLRIKEK